MDFKNIILKKEDHIATVVLNRPDELNAMNEAVIQELLAALDEVAEDDNVRVLILTGVGKAFSAGAQLKGKEAEKLITEEENVEKVRRPLRKMAQAIVVKLRTMEVPTIAMVNGPAVGAGFDLALACDLRVGSERARFAVSFTRVGIIPASGGYWLLPHIVGPTKAAELIFTADFVEAKEAERIGILNKVVSGEELEEETMKLARKIAEGPPIALRLDKMLLQRAPQLDLEAALELANSSVAITLASEDKKEAIRAFIEKRPPQFQGR